MKLCLGFISNSSSASFLLNSKDFKDVFEIVQKLLDLIIDELYDEDEEEYREDIAYFKTLKRNLTTLEKKGLDPNTAIYFLTSTNEHLIIKQPEGYYIATDHNYRGDFDFEQDEIDYDKLQQLKRDNWYFYPDLGVLARPLPDDSEEKICSKHEQDVYDEIEKIFLQNGKIICPLCDKKEILKAVVNKKLYPLPIIKEKKKIKAKSPKLSQEVIKEWRGHSWKINCVKFFIDGKSIISGGDRHEFFVFDFDTGKVLNQLSGHQDDILKIRISSDGHFFVSGSRDKNIVITDYHSRKELRRLVGHQQHVSALALSPDNHFLCSGSFDNTIKIWNVHTGEMLRSFEAHANEISDVVITSNGQYIISGSWDKSIKIWEFSTNKLLRTIKGHQEGISALIVSRDEKCIISGFSDGIIKIWDFESGQPLKDLKGHGEAITDLALSKDGRFLASASQDASIIIWNLETGKKLKRLEKYINSAPSSTRPYFEVKDFSGYHYFKGIAYSLDFDPHDARYLISAGDDRLITLWDLSSLLKY